MCPSTLNTKATMEELLRVQELDLDSLGDEQQKLGHLVKTQINNGKGSWGLVSQ